MDPLLEQLFEASVQTLTPGSIFVLKTFKDADDGVKYGSFQHVKREDLEGRQFKIIRLQEGKIELFFTDVQHQEREI